MGVTIAILLAHIQVSGCIHINFPSVLARLGFEPWTLVVTSRKNQHVAQPLDNLKRVVS